MVIGGAQWWIVIAAVSEQWYVVMMEQWLEWLWRRTAEMSGGNDRQEQWVNNRDNAWVIMVIVEDTLVVLLWYR